MKVVLLSVLLVVSGFIADAQEAFNFTLQNTSAKSIPLWIPGVMNPNLSPFSKSGVTLREGQEVFFKSRGKKRLLLEVTAEQDGQKLNVPKLIKSRKQELEKDKK